jgi:uncharacterized membrane protein HdeD (DUF308 family)
VKSLIGSLVLRGILALLVGVVAVAWPQTTVGAFVILFAVSAFLLAGAEAMRAFASRSAGPVIGRLLLAVLNVAAGIAALAWPGITALALTLLVAGWALVAGTMEFGFAFSSGETAGHRAMWGLSGLVTVAFGVVLAIRPDIGALSLAQIYGLYSIVVGICALVLAANAGTVTRDLSPTS